MTRYNINYNQYGGKIGDFYYYAILSKFLPSQAAIWLVNYFPEGLAYVTKSEYKTFEGYLDDKKKFNEFYKKIDKQKVKINRIYLDKQKLIDIINLAYTHSLSWSSIFHDGEFNTISKNSVLTPREISKKLSLIPDVTLITGTNINNKDIFLKFISFILTKIKSNEILYNIYKLHGKEIVFDREIKAKIEEKKGVSINWSEYKNYLKIFKKFMSFLYTNDLDYKIMTNRFMIYFKKIKIDELKKIENYKFQPFTKLASYLNFDASIDFDKIILSDEEQDKNIEDYFSKYFIEKNYKKDIEGLLLELRKHEAYNIQLERMGIKSTVVGSDDDSPNFFDSDYEEVDDEEASSSETIRPYETIFTSAESNESDKELLAEIDIRIKKRIINQLVDSNKFMKEIMQRISHYEIILNLPNNLLKGNPDRLSILLNNKIEEQFKYITEKKKKNSTLDIIIEKIDPIKKSIIFHFAIDILKPDEPELIEQLVLFKTKLLNRETNEIVIPDHQILNEIDKKLIEPNNNFEELKIFLDFTIDDQNIYDLMQNIREQRNRFDIDGTKYENLTILSAAYNIIYNISKSRKEAEELLSNCRILTSVEYNYTYNNGITDVTLNGELDLVLLNGDNQIIAIGETKGYIDGIIKAYSQLQRISYCLSRKGPSTFTKENTGLNTDISFSNEFGRMLLNLDNPEMNKIQVQNNPYLFIILKDDWLQLFCEKSDLALCNIKPFFMKLLKENIIRFERDDFIINNLDSRLNNSEINDFIQKLKETNEISLEYFQLYSAKNNLLIMKDTIPDYEGLASW